MECSIQNRLTEDEGSIEDGLFIALGSFLGKTEVTEPITKKLEMKPQRWEGERSQGIVAVCGEGRK